MKWYKNIKIRARLIIGFCTVLLLTVAIAIICMLQMSNLNTRDRELYENNTRPMVYLGLMYDTLASERICLNNMVIFRDTDPGFAAEEAESLKEKEALFAEALENYKATIPSGTSEINLYNSIYNDYSGAFAKAKTAVKNAIATGDEYQISEAVQNMDTLGAQVSGYMDDAFALNEEEASGKVTSNGAQYSRAWWVVIISLLVAVAIGYFIAKFINKTIYPPINLVKDIATQVGETGSLTFEDETVRGAREFAQYKDETGALCQSFAKMMDSIRDRAAILERVAHGDLTVDVALISEDDTLGGAVKLLVDNLNDKFSEISRATLQVSTGAGQMATGAQSLAQASTEQAGVIETLSDSVRDISDKTRDNTARAERAASLANTIKSSAEDGAEQMARLTEAVNKINESSQAIGSVIQVIDNIAFKTNILALNASVEAARAGQHGRGFAVVAEEVRNLAGQSAEAASNTSGLIADSIEKAKLGAKMADEAAAALEKIVNGINESAVVVGDIAKSSDEQNQAIAEVNQAIGQVSQVVQQNSAIAEQSAAASEEISGQSVSLQELIATFELKNPAKRLDQRENLYIGDDDQAFGKY